MKTVFKRIGMFYAGLAVLILVGVLLGTVDQKFAYSAGYLVGFIGIWSLIINPIIILVAWIMQMKKKPE